MKKYQDGEIYFIRESEYGTGKLSQFVKIGLVRYKDKRNSFGRLAEHQTANPRKLILDNNHIIKTQAVDMVEARLHTQFAKQRISGEWFEFKDEKSLSLAVDEANRLAAEVADLMPLFEEVMELEVVESNLPARPATEQEIQLAIRAQTARKQLEKCKETATARDALMNKAYSEGTDVSAAGKPSVTVYSPKFNEAEFKAENEELWTEYLTEEETWSHTFALDRKLKADSLGDDFERDLVLADEIITAVSKGGNFGDLVEVTQILRHLVGIAEWEDKVSTALLKQATGRHAKLEGACTWNRKWNPTTKFASARFAEDHPELAKKYVSTPEPKSKIVPKVGKTQ